MIRRGVIMKTHRMYCDTEKLHNFKSHTSSYLLNIVDVRPSIRTDFISSDYVNQLKSIFICIYRYYNHRFYCFTYKSWENSVTLNLDFFVLSVYSNKMLHRFIKNFRLLYFII